MHYHKNLTEVYIVLEGEGQIELDAKIAPINPFITIFINPGCRHRTTGKMRIVNVSIPAFDPDDEWLE